MIRDCSLIEEFTNISLLGELFVILNTNGPRLGLEK